MAVIRPLRLGAVRILGGAVDHAIDTVQICQGLQLLGQVNVAQRLAEALRLFQAGELEWVESADVEGHWA